MLLIDFFNVGDGDAVLLRERRADSPDFVALVDCGRPYIEYLPGSLRAPALTGLKRAGVDHIDFMLLSHLHIDHIGGACEIMQNIPVKRLMALYLPPNDAAWVTPLPGSTKSVVGMSDSLNMLRDIVHEAKAQGVALEEAENRMYQLTDALSIQVSRPDEALAGRQKALFDELYHGGRCDEAYAYTISKERNCSSLLARFDYAGRSVLLTGDSYGAYWEDAGQPHCDILKLPHHGDGKSMTEKLLVSLSPDYAVISCQNTVNEEKDRPCQAAIDMLTNHVPHVFCTENKPMRGFPASTHEAIRFRIGESGEIAFRAD